VEGPTKPRACLALWRASRECAEGGAEDASDAARVQMRFIAWTRRYRCNIQTTEGGLSRAHVETAKVDNEMVTKRRPQATEESSPRRSFNSIEFYSGVQLISLRSPLKSSLSSVAYCFTLRLPGRAYIRTFLFHIRTRTSKRPEGERARGSVAGHRQRNSSGYLNDAISQ